MDSRSVVVVNTAGEVLQKTELHVDLPLNHLPLPAFVWLRRCTLLYGDQVLNSTSACEEALPAEDLDEVVLTIVTCPKMMRPFEAFWSPVRGRFYNEFGWTSYYWAETLPVDLRPSFLPLVECLMLVFQAAATVCRNEYSQSHKLFPRRYRRVDVAHSMYAHALPYRHERGIPVFAFQQKRLKLVLSREIKLWLQCWNASGANERLKEELWAETVRTRALGYFQ